MDVKDIKFTFEKLTLDTRDFSHHNTFGTLEASQLPVKDFTIYDAFPYTIKWGDTLSGIANYFKCPLVDLAIANPQIKDKNKINWGQVITIPARQNKILDQLDLDFCPAFTAAELQNAGFGMFFDPLYQMAKIKQVRGEYTSFGANLRDGAQSVVKYGSLPAVLAPFTHNGSPTDKTRDYVANWANYAINLDAFASKYRDLSFFSLDGTYDTFDNIRSTLWMHLQERRGVSFGLAWHPEWTGVASGIIPDVMPISQGGGHNIAFVGQKTINGKLYLVCQNSWSDKFGDKGYYYFPRTIVDQAFKLGYGAMMFSRVNSGGMTKGTVMDYVNQLVNLIVGVFKK